MLFRSMHDAEEVRHEIPMEEIARVIYGVRQVVGPDIYINTGAPGTFAEIIPTPFTEEHAWLLSKSRSEERRVGKECRSRWSPYH